MDVVDKLCTKIAFIDEGKIIKVGNKEDFRKLLSKSVKISIGISKNKHELQQELEQQDFVINVNNKENGLYIELLNSKYYNKLFPIFGKYVITKIQEKDLSVEDIFIKMYE